MVNQPTFVSPLASWRGETAVSHPTFTLTDHSANGKISVQGNKADQVLHASHLAVGQGMEIESGQLYRLRHNLFYLSTPPEAVAVVMNGLETAVQQTNEFITVTDITNGRFEFHLAGRQSQELLSRLCGLDFHHFPHLNARQSSVAKTSQLILRYDQQNLPTYALIGARSFAMYVWETILKAGRDL